MLCYSKCALIINYGHYIFISIFVPHKMSYVIVCSHCSVHWSAQFYDIATDYNTGYFLLMYGIMQYDPYFFFAMIDDIIAIY